MNKKLGWLFPFKALQIFLARKVSQYGVFCGPYYSVISPNTGKHGPEKTLSLNTFHAVVEWINWYNRLLIFAKILD